MAKADKLEYYDEKSEEWITEIRDLSNAGLYYDFLMEKRKLGIEKFA